MSLIVAEYRDRTTTKTPASCRGCGAWVTGAARCLVCEVGEQGMRKIADPRECWQLSALLEAQLLLKRGQMDRHERRSSNLPAATLIAASRINPVVMSVAD